MTCRWSVFLLLALALFFSSCETRDGDHRILVSIADQSMELFHRAKLLARFPISTSRFGWETGQAAAQRRSEEWK